MIREDIIKNIFMIFIGLFVLTGIVFIGVGIGVTLQYEKYDPFISGQFYSQTILFFICGFLTLLITILGCFGTIKRNYCLMLTFCGLLILLFILAITAGIIGIVFRRQVWRMFDDNIKDQMPIYCDGNKEIQKAFDKLQMEFNCCGSEGYSDWHNFNETIFNVTGLPFSCCENYGKIGFADCSSKSTINYNDGLSWEQKNVRTEGCKYELIHFVGDYSYALGVIAFTFAAIHLIGILLSLLAAREVKNRQDVYRGF